MLAYLNCDAKATPLLRKLSVQPNHNGEFISERNIFHTLDTLHNTSTGLDGLPAWFLKVSAPCFARPLAYLFNLSLSQSYVPTQWKGASITPISKVPTPKSPADYRPISITPVLSRCMEKLVVREYIYPSLETMPDGLSVDDQFAFRPTGSTTAAIIATLDKITELLLTNNYVRVISLDFSKHSTQ